MNDYITFSTQHHTYMYSFERKEYIYIHPILGYIIDKNERGQSYGLNELEDDINFQKTPREELRYYWNKYMFLKKCFFLSERKLSQFGFLSTTLIEKKIEQLSSLTFEVTDKCNLQCKYCYYRDLYGGHDERFGKNMNFEIAKRLLDYLLNIWKDNTSPRTIVIGFYGGEPLLNFNLIQSIVYYIKDHTISNIMFSYNMTTNGLLLSKYIDFFVEYDFSILISLDGTKEDNCLRVSPSGENSYERVYNNVKYVQQKYSDYFKNRVSFNCVYHSTSNLERITSFFKSEFDKSISITEMNNSGVVKEKEYDTIYKNVYEDIRLSSKNKEINKHLLYNSPQIASLTIFLTKFISEKYTNYRDMYKPKINNKILPTGTCIPFDRKMFITVNGRILPCERISHEFSLGQISEDGIDFYPGQIVSFYNDRFKKIIHQCNHCYMQGACSQCFFYLNPNDNKINCHNYMSKQDFVDFLSKNISYLEQNPWAYNKIMTEITLF